MPRKQSIVHPPCSSSSRIMDTSHVFRVTLIALCLMPSAFGIQCYECTNQPGGKTNCSSILSDPSVGKITCPSMYDRCMMLKYSKSLAGQNTTVSVEKWNCTNNASCDPKNDNYSCKTSNSTGMLTECSVKCCQKDLCNVPFNSTEPVTVPPPTSAGLGLIASFGAILSAVVLSISG